MVSTDSSINCRAVFEAFQDMSLESEPVERDYVKSWMREWMPSGFMPEDPTTEMRNKMPWIGMLEKDYEYPDLNDVQIILDVFIEQRDNLIKMLVLLDYTWDVAERTVAFIIEDFQSTLLEWRLLPRPDCGEDYIQIICYDVSLFGRHLSLALCSGMHSRLFLSHNDVLQPFYCFFVQKCYESSIHSVISVKKTLFRNNLEIQIPCPMIIFEDADISSAVSSFCKSISKFKTTSSDVVSHLYIQESIFNYTISLLESTLKKMRHGSRFDKKTELEYIIPSEDIETSHNLKVFTPCHGSPIKLFIGWSPTDTDQSDLLKNSRGHIPSIPFRNSDDLVILLKELPMKLQVNNNSHDSSLSIWSENTSNITKIPYEQKFSTLWINSHGLRHPLIHCPQQLEPYIFYPNYHVDSLPKILSIVSDILSIISESHYYKDDLLKASKDSSETYKTWHFKKEEIKFQILEPLCKVFKSSQQAIRSRSIMLSANNKSVTEMIKPVIDTKLSDCLASEAQVMTKYQPVGVVFVYVFSYYKELETDLPLLISSLLIQGNAVVLGAFQNLLNHSASILKTIYEITSSYSLLTFLQFHLDTFEYKNIYNACKCSYDIKDIGVRFIFIGCNVNSPEPRDNSCHHFLAKQNNYLQDDEYCLQLSTISKYIWF